MKERDIDHEAEMAYEEGKRQALNSAANYHEDEMARMEEKLAEKDEEIQKLNDEILELRKELSAFKKEVLDQVGNIIKDLQWIERSC